MKLGVLEWDISAMGGRHRTMMCWADYLKSRGVDVTFYSSFWETREGYEKNTFLRWHSFEYLDYCDFVFFDDLQRNYKAHNVPQEWQGLDILIVPYGGYGYLQELLPNTKVICWVIHPDQPSYPSITEYWTNSKTTRVRLLVSPNYAGVEEKIHVVIPPHSYEIFWAASRPFPQREYDVCCVGSSVPAKGLLMFDKLVGQMELRGVILSSSWKAMKDDDRAVLGAVKHSKLLVNVDIAKVAAILGNSRVYVSFSLAESCSLALYEAMNAGCRPVVRDVGAAKEQMGQFGEVFTQNECAYGLVRSCLENPGPSPMAQGVLFDRDNVGYMIDRRLGV